MSGEEELIFAIDKLTKGAKVWVQGPDLVPVKWTLSAPPFYTNDGEIKVSVWRENEDENGKTIRTYFLLKEILGNDCPGVSIERIMSSKEGVAPDVIEIKEGVMMWVKGPKGILTEWTVIGSAFCGTMGGWRVPVSRLSPQKRVIKSSFFLDEIWAVLLPECLPQEAFWPFGHNASAEALC